MRERVTITIRGDLLRQVDRLVDGMTIRSRSQAVEFLLGKFLSDFKLGKALVLAGGKRKELLINRQPKFVLGMRGEPLLKRVLDSIHEFNVNSFLVYVDSFADKIMESMNAAAMPYHVDFIVGKHAAGTVTPMLLAKARLQDTFLVAYGDTITSINLNDMLSFHRKNRAIATIALTTVSNPKQYGVAVLQGNKVVEFEQKPRKEAHSFLVNAGYFIFEPEIFRHIGRKMQSIERELLPKLASRDALYGYTFQGRYFNINSQQDLEKAEAML
jgi:NDP-sugar pyrophosphorylase family protein